MRASGRRTVAHQARVVIIGGGIVGAAIAYHLTVVHGWDDIVLIDKGPLPYNDGSTSHAPGGVVAVSHSKLLTQMAGYSSDLYNTLDDHDPHHRVFQRLGGFEIGRTRARFDDFVRLNGEMTGWGHETSLMSAEETVEHLPFLDPSAFAGSLFVPKSGLVKGYHVVGDLMEKSSAARRFEWHEQTPFLGVEVEDGRVSAVVTGNPEVERIECEAAVIAANIWSPALTRHFGLEIPLMAFEHQYAVTSDLAEWAEYDPTDIDQEVSFPLVRDTDAALYYRKHWRALGVGSYAHAPRAVRSSEVGNTALRPFTEDDFAGAWALAQELIPMIRGVEADPATAYNGMFAFSVDGMPIIGESRHVGGLWSANASWITHAGGVAKSAAEWIVDGATEWDMRACHLYRFQPHATTDAYVAAVTRKNYREVYDIVHPKQPLTEPRNVRLSAFHELHVAAGAEFTTFAGFELPNWYESNRDLLDRHGSRIPERHGWGAEHWSPIMGAEHLALRETAGLVDLTGLSIIEVSGVDAVTYLNRLCTNQMDVPIGRVVYTCWLTERGGIRRDLAVARMATDRFWMFVGEGTLPMDYDWAVRHATEGVDVRDVSGGYSALGLFGPESRDILAAASPDPVDDAVFPYYTGRWIEVGMARVYAMRISYAGELGWELHIPVESSLAVWNAIQIAAAGRDLRLVGSGATDSLRLEKGYRLWGGDIHTEYNVYEAGLGWTAKLSKGDFIGRAATVAAKERGIDTTLVCLTLDDPAASLMGYEPVFDGDGVVGYVTTANYGYSVGMGIAYAYLPISLAAAGSVVSIEYDGVRYTATVADDPLWDPHMARMRG